jgi:hypothetical protein
MNRRHFFGTLVGVPMLTHNENVMPTVVVPQQPTQTIVIEIDHKKIAKAVVEMLPRMMRVQGFN